MPIAIYHLEAKVITRGTGRSAVAAAAYMSCSRIYNDYDGITHDYTRKQGLVWEQIFLPENAPKELSDRSVLWNAVEASEKSKDSRLARELIVALPKELSQETNEFLLQYFIEKECVAQGMCAHACYHDTDGHNPHAHIMLTMRPLNKDGTWQHKTEKEYLCVRNGEERGFTAADFYKPGARDGRSSIFTRSARKKNTSRHRRQKAWSVSINIPRAVSTADKTLSQNNGTAKNSFCVGERCGRVMSTASLRDVSLTSALTTEAIRIGGFLNSRPSTRV